MKSQGKLKLPHGAAKHGPVLLLLSTKRKLPHGAAKLSTARYFYCLALSFGHGPDDKTQVDTLPA